MAFYEAPTQSLAIFDPSVFTQNDEPLTITTGSKYFLRYPSAQGQENLQTTNVNGVLTANSTANFKRPLSMNDTTSSANRTINSSFYNFYDSNVAGSTNLNGSLYNSNGSMYLYNTVDSGTINFAVDSSSNVQSIPLTIADTGLTISKPTTMTANNNVFMSAGTGIINQAITSGSLVKNSFKLSDFRFNSGNASGTANAFEFYDEVNGKGLFLLPNSGGGSLAQINMANDCALISRSGENNNAITVSNWATNMKNGLRVFTTDISNCGLTLQCGQSNPLEIAELKMNYNRVTNTTTTSFNNTINFNPAGNVVPSKRLLSGLGTLSFTDICGNTILGTSLSTIWTDSSSSLYTTGLGGVFYDCGISTGAHQFIVNNAGTETTPFFVSPSLTSVNNTFLVRSSVTPSNRFDIVTDSASNTYIRARTSTPSANGIVNINCDTVSAGGVVTNSPVLTLTPFYLEVKKGIYLNYPSSSASSSSYLGYVTGPIAFSTVSLSSSASERNFNSFTITTAGTYSITLLITLAGSANHTLTEWRYCLDGTSATFPSTSTPTKYTPSINGNAPVSLDAITTAYISSSFNVIATAGNVFYLNYKMVFSGGGTTVMGCIYSYTRIG